jgi:predicted small lipoprotein YifL
VIAVAHSLSMRRAAALALVFGLTLLAAGCGRRGGLEPPNAGVATPAPASSDLDEQLGRPKNPPITPPKTPFVLDPIL